MKFEHYLACGFGLIGIIDLFQGNYGEAGLWFVVAAHELHIADHD